MFPKSKSSISLLPLPFGLDYVSNLSKPSPKSKSSPFSCYLALSASFFLSASSFFAVYFDSSIALRMSSSSLLMLDDLGGARGPCRLDEDEEAYVFVFLAFVPPKLSDWKCCFVISKVFN